MDSEKKYFWDPLVGTVPMADVSPDALAAHQALLAHPSKAFTGFAKTLPNWVKKIFDTVIAGILSAVVPQTASQLGQLSVISQIAATQGWGFSTASAGTRAATLYGMLFNGQDLLPSAVPLTVVTTGEIAQTEKLKIISNELWGSSIAGTQEYEWYSAEISNLDTEGMQSWPNQRVFFLRLPTIAQTRFELIPQTALSQLFDSNMKLESSQFNELFRIVRGSGTQGVDVTQVLNPVAMSVFLTIVQTDGPMRLWYQNNTIAILPYQGFPQVTAVSAPTETNMYAVIVDSQNQAMVKAYVDGIFLRVNTILQSLEQVVREPA